MTQLDPPGLDREDSGPRAQPALHSSAAAPAVVDITTGNAAEALRMAAESRRLSALPDDFRLRLARYVALDLVQSLDVLSRPTGIEPVGGRQDSPAAADGRWFHRP